MTPSFSTDLAPLGQLPAFLGPAGNPLLLTLLFSATALIPFLLLSVTSFVKISVVLNVLRSAVGAGQFPSAALVTVISLVLTLHIMAPVARESLHLSSEVWARQLPSTDRKTVAGNSGGEHTVSLPIIAAVVEAGSIPLRDFLQKHSRWEERTFFALLTFENKDRPAAEQQQLRLPEAARLCQPGAPAPAGSGPNCQVPGESFFTLMPAFVLSELRQAFAIGFLIYLPFLVVDLVVANILVGMGMMMVSPATISLPLKLMLFVAADGWFLLCRSLVLAYR